MLKAFLKYRTKAVNAHGIHSPFVFEFYNEVIKKAKLGKESQIEQLRGRLLKDKTQIEIEDFGAGSRKNQSNKRSISELTKNAAVSKKYGALLNRIVDFYGIENCLEMGTSMGVGCAYLAKKAKQVVTIEACAAIQNQAKQNLQKSNIGTIEFLQAEFDEGLKMAFESNLNYGLIYIDGNHQYQATLNYFNQLIDKVDNDTFLIFDDINWSEGMRKAWVEIVNSDKINVSIELFRMGIVLKRLEQTKQHFILKF